MDNVFPKFTDEFKNVTELATAMIIKPRGPVLNLMEINNIDVSDLKFVETVMNRIRERVNAECHQEIESERGKRMCILKEIRKDLLARCHGQSKAVETLIAQVATGLSQPLIPKGIPFHAIVVVDSDCSIINESEFALAWVNSQVSVVRKEALEGSGLIDLGTLLDGLPPRGSARKALANAPPPSVMPLNTSL